MGQYWRVFDFFKFRTMRVDADRLLQEVEHLNAYDGADGGDPDGDKVSASSCAVRASSQPKPLRSSAMTVG